MIKAMEGRSKRLKLVAKTMLDYVQDNNIEHYSLFLNLFKRYTLKANIPITISIAPKRKFFTFSDIMS